MGPALPQNGPMRTARGLERLIHFTDAVAAIALTLLVLPLTEIPGTLDGSGSFGEVFTEHFGELTAFGISFLVIWTLWRTTARWSTSVPTTASCCG